MRELIGFQGETAYSSVFADISSEEIVPIHRLNSAVDAALVTINPLAGSNDIAMVNRTPPRFGFATDENRLCTKLPESPVIGNGATTRSSVTAFLPIPC